MKIEWERQQVFFYWLCNVPGIGDKTIDRLLEKVSWPEALYYAKEEDLQAWREEGLWTEKQLRSFRSARRSGNLYSEYDKLQAAGIKMYPFYHPDYPERLQNIPQRPAVLFVKGKLPSEEKKSIAIIGARNCSEYGRRMAEAFAGALGKAGVQIISGLARGVDGISQNAALDAGGTSYGVLGCGVDICYPEQNREIYEKLITQGGVISSYLPGTLPKAQYFPPRNRIISGLADVVLVIEAREKSGTLITVDMALEQGREVYALPGRVGDAISEGCNRLIAQGAGIALSPLELLEDLGGQRVTLQKRLDCAEEKSDTNGRSGSSQTEMQEKKERAILQSLEETEVLLYQVLDDYPKTMETIRQEAQKKSGRTLSVPVVMEKMIQLCTKGLAKQDGGGFGYVKGYG